MLHKRFKWSILLLFLYLAPLAAQETKQTHVTLDAEARALQSAFNEDVGNVRVMMLLSPT